MAGAHSYALLVELEEYNVPRLKNKLVKYFQSKKSNGGDCEVDYENGSSTAVLRFLRENGKFGSVDWTLNVTLSWKNKWWLYPVLNNPLFKTVCCSLTDQKNVLAKEAHQISLDKGVLKMTVRLLTDEIATQVSAQEWSLYQKKGRKFAHWSIGRSLPLIQSETETVSEYVVSLVTVAAHFI